MSSIFTAERTVGSILVPLFSSKRSFNSWRAVREMISVEEDGWSSLSLFSEDLFMMVCCCLVNISEHTENYASVRGLFKCEKKKNGDYVYF